MRKLVALMLALVMVLSMTTVAWAAEGTITGTGTKEDPYVIADAADLAAFRNAVNSGTSYKGKFVALAADIDLEGAEWDPIGVDKNKPFQGTFDGQGHTIRNLYYNNADMSYVGLFGYAYGATIKNVNVENVDLTGYSYVGAITGRSYTGSISNCHVTGDIRIVSDYAYAGGITGGDYVALSDCSVIADGMGEITINQKTGAGGICGWHTEGNYLLSNLQVKNLNITAWTNLGGITGFVHYSNTIDGCSVENVNLTKTRDVGHPGFGMAAGGWSYNASKAITITNNSFKNITFNGTTVAKDSATILYGSEYSGKSTSNFVLSNNTVTGSITNNVVYTANDADGLKAALAAGGSVVLGADLTVTFDGNPTIYVANGATVDGNGYTLTLEGSVGSYASNCAFDNLTSGEAVTFENMTVVNNLTSGYAFGFADAAFNDMKVSGGTPFKPGNPIDADDALCLNNCEFTDFDMAIMTDGGIDTPVIINGCTFTVDAPADHYAVVLRNSESSSVGSTYNAKLNLYADDLAENITGNTFNNRVKIYNEGEKLSGNIFGANGYVEVEKGVDASTINLTANYWGGKAPAAKQYPKGAVTEPYYTVINEDGSFEDLIYTPGTLENPYTISSAAELAAFRDAVNGGNSYKGEFVVLTADIDLSGINWTPIGTWDNAFSGNFDGQGYTISNLYINDSDADVAGLFGVAENATFKGITVNNVDVSAYEIVAAIVGCPYSGCTISDCHVTGSINIVADYAYAGGIAAYGYVSFDNCSVIAEGTGVIKAIERNAVGGITAWMLEGANKITNCQVKNLDLTGWTNIGSITGFIHYSNVMDNCSAENINITKTRDVGHPGFGMAAGGWSYNSKKAITITNNSFNNISFNGTTVAFGSANILYGSEYGGGLNANFVLSNNTTADIANNIVYTANDAAGLRAALEAGGSVVLGADVTVTFDGDPTIYVDNGATVDGNGFTLTLEGDLSGSAFDNLTSGKAVTFENMTVVNNLTSGYAFGFADVAFNEVKVSGGTPFKPGNPIDADDALCLNNCEFTGFEMAIMTDDSIDTPVIINGCTFTVDAPADHYAVVLRNSESSSVGSTYNAKIALCSGSAKKLTTNTFNSCVEFLSEGEKLSGNTFGAESYVEIAEGVDASTINLSANYWGGKAPAEGQVPEGATLDTYYTIVKEDGGFDGLTSATGEDVKIPEHSTTTTEKPTESGSVIVEASTTVSSTTIETMVENNQGMVVEAPVDSAVEEVTDAVVVSFDAKATETLSNMANDIEVVITATTHAAAVEAEIITPEQAAAIDEKEVAVAVVLTADILVNGEKEAFATTGGVEIQVPFTPAEGNELTDYVVYFLHDNGSLAKVPTDYVDGKLVISLQHFSSYIIGTQPVCGCALASSHLVPGAAINLPNPTAKNYTVSAKWKYGKSMVEDIKWNKEVGMWQIILKDNFSLSEERELKGTLTFKGTGTNKGATATVTVDEIVCNHIQYIWGEAKAKDATEALDTSDAPLLIMDEDGGYVKFEKELLTGLVEMDKNEKTFLNIIYGYVEGVTEDTIDAFEAYIGEDYIDDAIIEYYTFEGTNPFKNEVAFSYEAYVEDPHYFYQWKDGQLTKFDVEYNDDEEVEAWQWNAIADGTIIVTDVEIVLSAETSKNPNTGACTNNVASMAAALAVSFMVAAGAVALKK